MVKRSFICYRVVAIIKRINSIRGPVINLSPVLSTHPPPHPPPPATQCTLDLNISFSPLMLCAACRPVIRHWSYIKHFEVDPRECCVQQVSQCEGMLNVVKAGNVAALGRKSLAVVRKQAASQLQIFDLEHRCKTAAFLWAVCRWRRESATCSLAYSEPHLPLLPCKQ